LEGSTTSFGGAGAAFFLVATAGAAAFPSLSESSSAAKKLDWKKRDIKDRTVEYDGDGSQLCIDAFVGQKSVNTTRIHHHSEELLHPQIMTTW